MYVQEHRWTTSWGYTADSAKDALQRNTFEVGITLLTAASLSADNSLDSTHGLDIDNINWQFNIIHGLDG